MFQTTNQIASDFWFHFAVPISRGHFSTPQKKTAGIRTLRTVELRGRLTSHCKDWDGMIRLAWSCSKIFGNMVCISYIYIVQDIHLEHHLENAWWKLRQRNVF